MLKLKWIVVSEVKVKTTYHPLPITRGGSKPGKKPLARNFFLCSWIRRSPSLPQPGLSHYSKASVRKCATWQFNVHLTAGDPQHVCDIGSWYNSLKCFQSLYCSFSKNLAPLVIWYPLPNDTIQFLILAKVIICVCYKNGNRMHTARGGWKEVISGPNFAESANFCTCAIVYKSSLTQSI